MRPVTGLERPVLQWMLVAACVVLTGLLAVTAASVRGKARQIQELLDAQRASRSDVDALHAQLARERAAREAFSVELARLRAQQPEAAGPALIPTFTLVPPTARRGSPPDPTLTAPENTQTIELRLVLPNGVTARYGEFQIAARDWSTGQTRWTTTAGMSGMVDGRRAVTAHITGEMLKAGTYEVVLTRSADVASAPEPIAVYELGIRKE